MVKACEEIGLLKDELHQVKADNQDLASENRYIKLYYIRQINFDTSRLLSTL